MPKGKKTPKSTINTSVWVGTTKKQFALDVDELLRLTEVPNAHTTYSHEWKGKLRTAEPHGLPFDVEMEMADDVAFISQNVAGGDHVTAVTVHVPENQSSMKLTMAANKGVSPEVKQMMHQITKLLEACAKQEIRRDNAFTQILEGVITLNERRIKSRLATRASRPVRNPGNSAGSTSMAIVLRDLIVHDLRPLVTDKNQETCAELESASTDLHSAILAMNTSQVSHRIASTIEVVHRAHRMLGNYRDLAERLYALGLPKRTAQEDRVSRAIRQISKIAYYQTVCTTLVSKSRSYRTAFSNIDIEYVPCNLPEQWLPFDATERLVHAEIQLLIHLETNHVFPHPRVIGVSKAACFLCDKFIKAHGGFFISKTHGRLYCRWTIPERASYSTSTRERIRAAIKKTHASVKETTKSLKPNVARQTKLQYPVESFLNLEPANIRTPSVMTARSSIAPTVRSASTVQQQTPSPGSNALHGPERISAGIENIQRVVSPTEEATAQTSIPKVFVNDIEAESASPDSLTPRGPPSYVAEKVAVNSNPHAVSAAKSVATKSHFTSATKESSNPIVASLSSAVDHGAELKPQDFPPELSRPKKPFKLIENASLTPSIGFRPCLKRRNKHVFISLDSITKSIHSNRVTRLDSKSLNLEITLDEFHELPKHGMSEGLVSMTPVGSIKKPSLPIVDVEDIASDAGVVLGNGDLPVGQSSFILRVKQGKLVRVDCFWPHDV